MTRDAHERREIEDWRNEHGLPDFAYLQSLATDGGPEATEKLKSIAIDLNVEGDLDAPPEELIEAIRSAVARNQEGGLDATT